MRLAYFGVLVAPLQPVPRATAGVGKGHAGDRVKGQGHGRDIVGAIRVFHHGIVLLTPWQMMKTVRAGSSARRGTRWNPEAWRIPQHQRSSGAAPFLGNVLGGLGFPGTGPFRQLPGVLRPGMERLGVEVRSVGPDQRMDLRVDDNPPEQVRLTQPGAEAVASSIGAHDSGKSNDPRRG